MPAPPRFSGTDGISASRWLRQLNYTLSSGLSPVQWLSAVDTLLTGDAAVWADLHPRVRRILTEKHLPRADKKDVEMFKKSILARFPTAAEIDDDELDMQLAMLRQEPLESLRSYCERAGNLLHALGGVDRNETPLTNQEEVVLRKVGDAFVHGLNEEQPKDSLARYGRQFVQSVDNDTLGLEELCKAAELLEVNARLEREVLAAESEKRELSERWALIERRELSVDSSFGSPSSAPELSFSGLFGSSGNAHDSFTRSQYGINRMWEGAEILSPRGIVFVAKGVADHWMMDENIAKLTAQMKKSALPSNTAKLDDSQPTLPDSTSVSVPGCDINAVASSPSSSATQQRNSGGFDCLSMFGRPTAPGDQIISHVRSSHSGHIKSLAADVRLVERPKSTSVHASAVDVTAGPSSSGISKPKTDVKLDHASNSGHPVRAMSTQSMMVPNRSSGNTANKTSSAGSNVLSTAASKAITEMASSKSHINVVPAKLETPKLTSGDFANGFSTPYHPTDSASAKRKIGYGNSSGNTQTAPSAPSSNLQPPSIPRRRSSLEKSFGNMQTPGLKASHSKSTSLSAHPAAVPTASSSKVGSGSQVDFASATPKANGFHFTFPTVSQSRIVKDQKDDIKDESKTG